jgi:hypothetical protein
VPDRVDLPAGPGQVIQGAEPVRRGLEQRDLVGGHDRPETVGVTPDVLNEPAVVGPAGANRQVNTRDLGVQAEMPCPQRESAVDQRLRRRDTDEDHGSHQAILHDRDRGRADPAAEPAGGGGRT